MGIFCECRQLGQIKFALVRHTWVVIIWVVEGRGKVIKWWREGAK